MLKILHFLFVIQNKKSKKIKIFKEIKSEIPLALDGGMNDNNRTAGTVGIAY